MDPSTDTVTIVLSRSLDGRRWIATAVYQGDAVGRGASAGAAVEDLLRWRANRPEGSAPRGGER